MQTYASSQSPELCVVAPDGEGDLLPVGRPRRLRLVRRIRRDLHRGAAGDRHPKHLKESVGPGRDERNVATIGRDGKARRIVFRRELMNDARITAVARDNEDDVTSWT